MIRDIIIPNSETILINIPKEYINHKVEYIVFPIEEKKENKPKEIKLTTFKNRKKIKDFSREDAYDEKF